LDSLARHRMREREGRGVQELAAEPRLGYAVDGVADDGKPDCGEVHPDLVHAAGLELDSEQRVAVELPFDLEVGDRGPRTFGVEGDSRRVATVAAEWCFDSPAAGSRPAAHERQIAALECPPADEPLQAPVRLLRAGDDEEAGRVAVEPVHDAGPLRVVAAPGPSRERIGQRPRPMTGAGMD